MILHGKSVGTFTSSHLHTVREQIRVNDVLIFRADVVHLWVKVQAALTVSSTDGEGWYRANLLDKVLGVTLAWFVEQRVEYIILEVGIGGRYDPTNFIARPAVCVVTSVSKDHTEMLGESLEAIAWQKAGILKGGGNTVCLTPAAPSLYTRPFCPLGTASRSRKSRSHRGDYLRTFLLPSSVSSPTSSRTSSPSIARPCYPPDIASRSERSRWSHRGGDFSTFYLPYPLLCFLPYLFSDLLPLVLDHALAASPPYYQRGGGASHFWVHVTPPPAAAPQQQQQQQHLRQDQQQPQQH